VRPVRGKEEGTETLAIPETYAKTAKTLKKRNSLNGCFKKGNTTGRKEEGWKKKWYKRVRERNVLVNTIQEGQMK